MEKSSIGFGALYSLILRRKLQKGQKRREKEGVVREISPFECQYLTPATFCLELFLNMFPFLIYVF
jgi:hypothetical protein